MRSQREAGESAEAYAGRIIVSILTSSEGVVALALALCIAGMIAFANGMALLVLMVEGAI
jgi:hypothetical protein